MSMFWCIISLILLAQTHQQSCTLTCVNMFQSMCKICYCSEDQSFKNCTLYKCSESRCSILQYELVALSQEHCFAQCCGDQLKGDKFTAEAVQACKKLEEQSIDIAWLIVQILLVIVMAVGLFVFIFFAYRSCKKCYQQKKSLRWSKIQSSSRVLSDKNFCSVCMSQGAETQTKCKHKFHFKCLTDWIEKNNACPNCYKKGINSVKYFCKKCHNQYVLLDVKNQAEMESFKVTFLNHQCPNCK